MRRGAVGTYGRPMASLPTSDRARLLEGTGLAERRQRLAGISTAILEAGSGPPLILLHGGIECGGVYWAPAVARLAQEHRLVLPDLPGLGESEPAPQLDTGTFASWLGASMSANWPAAAHPRRALPLRQPRGAIRSRARRFAAEVARLRIARRRALPDATGLVYAAIRFGMRPSRRNSERFDRWAFFDLEQARARDPGWFEAWTLYTMSRARVQQVKRTMRKLISRGRKRVPDDVLRRIQVPTTLLWGRHDRFVPLAVGEQASKSLGWRLRVIDRAGHVPHIERPESFVGALRATIDPHPNRSAA